MQGCHDLLEAHTVIVPKVSFVSNWTHRLLGRGEGETSFLMLYVTECYFE